MELDQLGKQIDRLAFSPSKLISKISNLTSNRNAVILVESLSMNEILENAPPKLLRGSEGEIVSSSIADLVEWFLNYDEQTARMRHPNTNELFLWKQNDDAANGIGTYPFENAEARFAIGVFQALEQNTTEAELNDRLTAVLNALHESRESKAAITDANRLDADAESSAVKRSELLTTNVEKRLYLTSCWLEAICTAEARVLGWIYQDIYGRPFSPE